MLFTIVDMLYSFEVTNYRNACGNGIFDKLTVAEVIKKFLKSFETRTLSNIVIVQKDPTYSVY